MGLLSGGGGKITITASFGISYPIEDLRCGLIRSISSFGNGGGGGTSAPWPLVALGCEEEDGAWVEFWRNKVNVVDAVAVLSICCCLTKAVVEARRVLRRAKLAGGGCSNWCGVCAMGVVVVVVVDDD